MRGQMKSAELERGAARLGSKWLRGVGLWPIHLNEIDCEREQR